MIIESDKQPEENKTIEHEAAAPRASRFPRWAAIGAAAFVALGGLGIASAMSNDMMGPGPRHMMERVGWGGHGHGGPGHGPGGFGRVMKDLNLTDEQEDKIWALADEVRKEARPVMRDFRGSREELTKLLSAPTIDKAAVEKLRSERVAAVDAASKKLADALVNAAETLTPEQRTKLADNLEDIGPRGRW